MYIESSTLSLIPVTFMLFGYKLDKADALLAEAKPEGVVERFWFNEDDVSSYILILKFIKIFK